jgi:2-hydroxychromene-2-carboxylate isomerase
VSTSAPIDFYFDFASPYGYIASTRIDEIAGRHGRAVAWRPILLGVVFKTTGMGPLPSVPLKGQYSLRDFARSARLLGIPFQMPKAFPFNGIAPSRAFYWLRDRDPDLARRFAQAAYHAAFPGQQDITKPEVCADLAANLGVKREETLAALNDAAVKDRLRVEVEAAIAQGVFGSPFIVVDGEPFWGADRLDQVERWMQTGGW